MKLSFLFATLSSFALLSSNSQGQAVFSEEDCAVLKETGFQTEFEYMVNRAEGCMIGMNCDFFLPHWKESPIIKVFSSKSSGKSHNLLIESLTDSMQKISSLTGLKLRFSQGEDPTMSIFVLDQDMIEMLERSDLPDTFKNDLRRVDFRIYEKGSCSGLFFSNSEDNSIATVLSGAFIFVNSKLPETEMASCLREELMNTMGLIGDPIGQASLFDNGNYIDDNGIKDYSRETELMLYALYQIAHGKYENINAFVAGSCVK